MVLVAAACGNVGDDDTADPDDDAPREAPDATDDGDGDTFVPLDEPGVTDDEIRVVSIASETNPLGTDYGAIGDGARAYFEMINAAGGIWGRELRIVNERDDEIVRNPDEVQAALVRDDPFAVLIATLVFGGAETLEREGVPTFGWNINPEWAGHEHLYGNLGAICFGCPGRIVPWLAREVGATSVGIVGYGVSAQSEQCAVGNRRSFEAYGEELGIEVGFFDASLTFGQADRRPQADGIKQAGVDLVTTCMDLNGVHTLAEALRAVQHDVVFHHPNMYDHEFIAANAQLFEGDYVIPQFFAFEHDDPPDQLELFFEWTDRLDIEVREVTMVGWIAADQLVTGLRAAGPEFSRSKVVDALNSMTYDAGGLIVPIDWTKQHQSPVDDPAVAGDLECANFTQVRDGALESVFVEDGKPFVCFETTGTRPEPWIEPTHLRFDE